MKCVWPCPILYIERVCQCLFINTQEYVLTIIFLDDKYISFYAYIVVLLCTSSSKTIKKKKIINTLGLFALFVRLVCNRHKSE